MNILLEKSVPETSTQIVPLQAVTLIGRTIVYFAHSNREQKLVNFVNELLQTENIDDYHNVFCIVIKHV